MPRTRALCRHPALGLATEMVGEGTLSPPEGPCSGLAALAAISGPGGRRKEEVSLLFMQRRCQHVMFQEAAWL